MKILHILISINTGGAEKFCVDICNTQSEISDNEIYLCVVDSINNQPLVKMISSKVKLISLNKQGGYSLKMIYKIYQLLSQIKPDIIHLNGRALIYSSIPIILKRIPSVYTVHTMAHKESYNKYIRGYIKFIFNKFPSLFTPVSISKSVSETVKQTYGECLATVINNGSSKPTISSRSEVVAHDINKLKKDNDTLVFLTIGRISKYKNIVLLVRAFNKLLDDDQNVCLCIVGYDATLEQSYLLECENENKYPEKIHFVGRRDNVADYLLCADAFCLTSTLEGFGLVVLEAHAMGVPVLSTPSGGPSEIIIPGINGYLSKQITVESYIEILNDFIEKPLRDKDKIIKIYEEKYTMRACALQYMELYQSRVIYLK